ncbi:L-proline glycine betaine ABC transport system permease protein ProW [Streptococcus sp. DD11]|uniref:ABC transporter permease/substrate binding protein n=1 Tax=Streptococcus sp. DD11 TaxID=1777879 RepID=UPI00079BFA23|nr:ABC transporter permease/substrate binding protein [Streptococcus sp. DD11]KXT85717.1 L-proline glycine betaine ABC transport system permease protein ProW [Streptococcus sp. DD11]
MNILQQPIPVSQWVEAFTNWVTDTFSGLFSVLQAIGSALMNGMTDTLLFIPPLLFIAVITVFTYLISNRKLGLPLLTFLGLLFVYNQGLWENLMNTVTLVIVSSLISIIIGIPLGIWMAKSNRVEAIVKPLLDFMQTMPAFVYLIPAVAFFGIGMVPGVFASVIFALPPTVRFTNLAIRQIPTELIEASDSFGGTAKQKLFKVELPLAKNTILAGVNQTIMLALSMVVTASMIGAPGLGRGVLSALQHADIGSGFVNGVSLVILAIVIDRLTQKLNQPLAKKAPVTAKEKRKKVMLWSALAAVLLTAFVGNQVTKLQGGKKEAVNLAYVEWDSEVASTNVVAELLKEMGYDVTITPLDNAVMWKSVANSEADAMVSAWLPTTHASLYEEYKDKIVDLGPNLEGVKVGLVVPAYTDANSIEDLTNQAKQTITGIEPGAGVMAAAEKTMKEYSNLSGWNLSSSSTGAMTTALDQAIKNKEDIIITGWSPHWMFSKYDLKYLEDPKGTMGGKEAIHTITRQNLDKDLPEVNKVLDNFNWTQKDMEEVMLKINEGTSPEAAAKEWIKNHQKEVDSWKK